MYEALARAILEGAASDGAALRVRRLRERHPRASRSELSERLVRRAALRCAAASALLTGPAAFFGAMPFGADLAYQAAVLNRLVLELSVVSGRRASVEDRVAGAAAGVAAGVGAELLRQGTVRVLRRVAPGRPGARAAAGALLGGFLGYAAALTIGRVTRQVLRTASRFDPRRLSR